jgi:hypothetical protein
MEVEMARFDLTDFEWSVSSIRVHQHAANAQKKTSDVVAWVARGAA